MNNEAKRLGTSNLWEFCYFQCWVICYSSSGKNILKCNAKEEDLQGRFNEVFAKGIGSSDLSQGRRVGRDNGFSCHYMK